MRDYMREAFGEPTPKQEEFYAAKTRYVGYGGSRDTHQEELQNGQINRST